MPAPDYTHMKVVLIDDNDMVRDSLKSALKEFGFFIESFQEPLKAIDWIEKNGADIIISDICMPKCDGFEVLKRVKAIDPSCDVIFITAHGQVDTAIRALREGATDFFEKPFTTEALSVAIERTSRFRILYQQKELLTERVNILSSELLTQNNPRNLIIGRSEGIKKIAESIINVADTTATVLITGESGTGKELAARAVHVASSRKDKPFMTVNCPSVPEELFESELFGHRKGAFTGAIETKGGYVQAAEGGTLFLDEIGDLPLKSQAKILRLLEQKTYLPVGENMERVADVRVIAATNQRLDELVSEKQFREDLYYRLKVCSIVLPPLRERKDDIPLLATHFVLQFSSEMGKPIDGITQEAISKLTEYGFPGNIRELRNIIESSIIHCQHTGEMTVADFPDSLAGLPEPATSGWSFKSLNMDEVTRELITSALEQTNSNVSAASRMLGISRGKLRRALESLNIDA
jgi:DNA-binding NtrC family response regulator